MRNPLRYGVYFIFSALSITAFVYYLIYTKEFELYGYSISFLVLIASIFYTIYMFFFELLKSDNRVVDENVMNDHSHRNFVRDVFYKFLACFALVVLVYYVIYMFRTNFHNFDKYPTNGFLVADIYTNLILPVYLIMDMFITTRCRYLTVWADLLIIFGLVVLHIVFRLFVLDNAYKNPSIVFPILSDYLIIFLLAVNGYALYDYMLFKRQRPGEDYPLLHSVPIHQP